jgi:hypothetical protein
MKLTALTRTGFLSALLALSTNAMAAEPLRSAFTYQGQLTDGAGPANGTYDLRFAIYDSAGGAGRVGPTLTNTVSASNGLFTVTLDFGPGPFTGDVRWLEIAVRATGSPAEFTLLTPRQPLTPTPYALFAPTAGAAATASTAAVVGADGVTSASLQANAVTSGKIADGTIAVADLSPALASNTFWRLGGNAGTVGGTHFLGTTDNQPVELRANGQRAVRIEPGTNSSPNLIGGAAVNTASPGVVGATIGGGGATNHWSDAQRVMADYATIGGGRGNTVSPHSAAASIGGGWNNFILSDSESATIAGGYNNRVWTNSPWATIAGGYVNEISDHASNSVVAGGYLNVVSNASDATIGGGHYNRVLAHSHGSLIGGGTFNTVEPEALDAVVAGGLCNTVRELARFGTVLGGYSNEVAGTYALAAGRRAKANHPGAFVWADSTDADFASTADNQFLIRATGGVGLGGPPTNALLDVEGDLRINSHDLLLGSDTDPNHGLGYYGTWLTNKFFAGKAPDGPVLYGFAGGGLGTTDGGQALALSWNQAGKVALDPLGANTGGVAPGLVFGDLSSGEGIASKRSAGGNQWGLDFYTGNQSQMSITIGGNVGIGLNNPATKLHVAGEVRAETFSGNGSGLTGISGSALAAGSVSNAQLAIDAVTADRIASSQVVKALNGLKDEVTLEAGANVSLGIAGSRIIVSAAGGSGATGGWSLTGNAGTASTNFLGTTDDRPLEFKVRNERAWRLEPGFSGTEDAIPNLIGGWASNTVSAGVVGAVIGGGGDPSDAGIPRPNRVTDHYGVVSGGAANTAGDNDVAVDDARFATVGGGYANEASGSLATVGGGYFNRATFERATIAGGWANAATNHAAVVGGGRDNIAGGSCATVPGGQNNRANGQYSFAAGSRSKADHPGAFVWADSTATDFASTAPNQFLIRATGGVGIGTVTPQATLDVAGTVKGTTLEAGAVKAATLIVSNTAVVTNLSADLLDGLDSSVFWKLGGNSGTTPGTHFLGTMDNQALELKVNGMRALRLVPTATGSPNVLGGSPANFVASGVAGATIAGGGGLASAEGNSVAGNFGTISGGKANRIVSTVLPFDYCTIAGGTSNEIRFAHCATISGGLGNTNEGWWAWLGGGGMNHIRNGALNGVLAGGNQNILGAASEGTIGGGLYNAIADADRATICGGLANSIESNGSCSVISGGRQNTNLPNAVCATIPGGQSNTATNYAFASGRRAKAIHTGAFVWADSTDCDFASTGNDQLLIRASGGVGIGTNAPRTTLHVNGSATVSELFNLSRTSMIVAAGNTVTPTSSFIRLNAYAAVTLNASTAIADGSNTGCVLILEGTNDTNSVTVPDNANTRLSANRTLGANDTLMLIWDGDNWVYAASCFMPHG